MNKPSRMPFRNMTPEAWQNLALAALAIFYVAQIVLDVVWHNTFGNLGIDFASFWSAGRIANGYGYAKVYDLQLMQHVQEPLVPTSDHMAFKVIPTPYLAVFVIPFQLFALLPAVPSAWLWMLLNSAVLLLYLRFFITKISQQAAAVHQLALAFTAVPVFTTLFAGQVNVWLMICIGEFLRAITDGREWQAGLWLGGLLLKPQTLVILVPALLLQRSFKVLAGLTVSSGSLTTTSMLLAGRAGMLQMLRLWLGYAGGLPTNDPQLMMNWRMIGLQIGSLTSETLGMLVALVGLALTFLAALYLWRRPLQPDSPGYRVAMTGTLAATGAVAWHSHAHTAIIMVPIFLLLTVKERGKLGRRWEAWVLLPAGLYFIRLMLASAMHAGFLPAQSNGLLDLLAGAGLFAFNLYLLGWAIHQRSSGPALVPRAADA